MIYGDVDMLEERMLYSLQDLFVSIRFYAGQKNEEMIARDYERIKQQQALVEHLSEGIQKELLIYCFINLSEMIEKSNYQMAEDFADAVHNLPEVFIKPYDLKQYWKTYIKPLNIRYKQKYFEQFKPFFKRKADRKPNGLFKRMKAKKEEKAIYK